MKFKLLLNSKFYEKCIVASLVPRPPPAFFSLAAYFPSLQCNAKNQSQFVPVDELYFYLLPEIWR